MPVPFNDAPPSPALVTGGAGFIGSHLVEALVALGLKVRVIDDLSGGRAENLTSVRDRIDFHRIDIRDRPSVERLVRGAGVVFHMAAMSSVPQSLEDPSLCLDINGQGTLNVLELAAKAGVRRLVYASTSAVYGDLPAPHSEDLRPAPNSPYAAAKLLGEHLGDYFRQTMGLLTMSLRFFNVYGPRQTADGPDAGVIPVFFQALRSGRPAVIHGDGLQSRDFIHVSDVVEAVLLAARVQDPPETTLNIGTGRAETVIEVLRLLKGGFPRAKDPVQAPARPGDPLLSEAVVEKSKKVLGFEAKITLKEGLKSLASLA
jgi:UDP-glucose 4-epimerase